MRVYKVNLTGRDIIETVDIDDQETIARLPFVKGDVEYLPERRQGPVDFKREYQTLTTSPPVVKADHVLVVETAEWRPAAELRAIKKEEVEDKRDEALAGGIGWAAPDGAVHRIQSDAASRDNLTGVAAGIAAGLPLPAGFSWRTADNIDVQLDQAGLLSLAGSMMAHVNACWRVSWAKKAAIDALPDPAAIAGYDATAGWQ